MLIIGIGSKGEDTRAIYLSTGVWRSKQKLAASERVWFTIEGVGSIEGSGDSGGGTRIKGFKHPCDDWIRLERFDLEESSSKISLISLS